MMWSVGVVLLLFSLLSRRGSCVCYEPSPAFPPPQLNAGSLALNTTFSLIEASLRRLGAREEFADASFAVEVTSSSETLWSYYHTAQHRNESRPGAPINGTVGFRIASITKVFTVLGILQQHAAGNLSLEDPISKYVPALGEKSRGGIPWHDITLRSLASQLSGIPNDWAQSDLINYFSDPTLTGLPPVSFSHPCDEYTQYKVPCTANHLIKDVDRREPVFAPNAQSTYSNLAFELLGLALQNVSGVSYEEQILSSILMPIGMNHSGFKAPPDNLAAIPNGNHYWDVDEGVQNPTGGLYSTSNDLSRFLRYVLTHYNGLTPSLNWLQPFSWGVGASSFFGMPWEIYRSSTILADTRRPVTFATKAGGLPGYTSNIVLMPEFDLGVTILVANDRASPLYEILEKVTVPLIRGAEVIAQTNLKKQFTGTFASDEVNSTITLSQDPSRGLHITSWVSNSTEMLEPVTFWMRQTTVPPENYHLQLVPTLLYKDEPKQKGEIWRMVMVPGRPDKEAETGYWDDFCITDIDSIRYGGLPLNELVFWDEEHGEPQQLEMPAFRITLSRQDSQEESHSQAQGDWSGSTQTVLGEMKGWQ